VIAAQNLHVALVDEGVSRLDFGIVALEVCRDCLGQ
jgi:hypothetical protein